MSQMKKYESMITMVESEMFTIEMLMHHLKDSYETDGVREILVTRLYKYDKKLIMFYIPELW